MTDSIYHHPALYDLITGHGGEDVKFFKAEAISKSGSVLEVACGSGRILNELARTGLPCTGIDIESTMIHRAKELAEHSGLHVDYQIADMRNFYLGTHFDLVFIPMNSLLHLHSDDEILLALKSCGKHLSTNGHLIVSIFNPSLEILNRNPNSRFDVTDYKDPNTGKSVNVTETCSYDEMTKVLTTTWYHSSTEKADLYTHAFKLRVLYPDEFKALVEKTGLKIEHFFGGYDKHEFVSSSRLQVYVLKMVV